MNCRREERKKIRWKLRRKAGRRIGSLNMEKQRKK
jgi:hypothetical protein